jgi:hypothetical protein
LNGQGDLGTAALNPAAQRGQFQLPKLAAGGYLPRLHLTISAGVELPGGSLQSSSSTSDASLECGILEVLALVRRVSAQRACFKSG